jgi:hypothetical protein
MESLKKEYENLLISGRNLPAAEFSQQVDNFLSGKTEVEKELLRNYMVDSTKERVDTILKASEEISILKQLDGIEEYINLSKLSQNYFGKSRAWLYQRLHGYQVHDKPAAFTDDEKRKLSDALLSLSGDIRNVALKFA